MLNDSVSIIILDGDEAYCNLWYSFSVVLPCCTRALVGSYKIFNRDFRYGLVGAVEVRYYRMLGRDIKRSVIHCVKCVSDEKNKKIIS
jgi:hypothetical protein